MSITEHPNAYVTGSLKMTLNTDNTFTLTGNCFFENRGTDHQQLIYEALEIAANSRDRFANQFRAMCNEYLELTKDWDK